jgi:CHAD domain-containing protein
VHQARVATRRLREALPLVRGRNRERRRLRRELRRVTQALGPVRELDVALTMARTLASDWPAMSVGLDHVTATLTELRARRRARLLKRVHRDAISEIVERTDRYLSQAVPEGAARPALDRERLADRVTERASTAAGAAESAGALYAPEALHAVRIATKKLRYALEMARVIRVAGAARAVTRLRQYQDLLGLLHDLQILSSHVARAQARIAVDDPDLAVLSDLLVHLEDRCRELHAAFVARRGALVLLCREVETTFARPRAVARSS